MAAQELDSIPLVAFDPVANAQNEWVALCLRVASGDDMPARLQAVFGMPDLLAAIAPLDGLLMVDSPAALTHPVLALLPANRIGFTVLTLPQLKILQEVITLVVFVPFAVLYMHQAVKLDFLWAGLCLLGAVYFMFRN